MAEDESDNVGEARDGKAPDEGAKKVDPKGDAALLSDALSSISGLAEVLESMKTEISDMGGRMATLQRSIDTTPPVKGPDQDQEPDTPDSTGISSLFE